MKFLIDLLNTDTSDKKLDDVYFCHCCLNQVDSCKIVEHFIGKKCFYNHPNFFKLFDIEKLNENTK
jgi:hypothetical protein